MIKGQRFMLDQPHHDGSALYISEDDVWVRVPSAFKCDEVYVRSVVDGEPRFTRAHLDQSRTGRPVGGYGAADRWFKATLYAHNPVTPYRFLFGDRWLTAEGVVSHDVTDATDFKRVLYDPPPSWMQDAIVYEIFPDRFGPAPSPLPPPDWAIPADWDSDPVLGSGPGVSEQFYGGHLDGVTARLDHIQSLGANTVYLTPIFPARSNHRYDASTFDHVDPLLGGDLALKRLSEAVHARGMRLIGDITTNHVGSSHEWFRSGDRSLFYFEPDGSYESWCGVPSLPKLNWGNPAVRERMTNVMLRWLEYVDGWRVDVANMTGRYRFDDFAHEIARSIRQALPASACLIAEHNHDATRDLDRDGWHGTMNYGGFLRPLWTWLRGPDVRMDNFLGWPGNIPSRDGHAVLSTIRSVAAQMSWRSYVHSWQLLDSHDSARIRTITGSRRNHVVALALQATLPGTPMIFACSEFGLTGRNGEHSRTPMPWNRPQDQDLDTLSAYRDLLTLRTREPALRHGSLRWIHADADSLAFIRETESESLLVAVSRSGAAPTFDLPTAANLYDADGVSIRRLRF